MIWTIVQFHEEQCGTDERRAALSGCATAGVEPAEIPANLKLADRRHGDTTCFPAGCRRTTRDNEATGRRRTALRVVL